jgi:hypothetical protein
MENFSFIILKKFARGFLMKKIIVFLGTIGLSIVLSSCATLTRGTEEALEIKTEPS